MQRGDMAAWFDGEKAAGWIARVNRGVLAGVFLFAAVPKLIDLDSFTSIIDAYGILPQRWLTPVALILIGLELTGGLGLFLKRRRYRIIALTVIFCLLVFFILVLGYGLRAGLDIDCGCFGKAEPAYRFFSTLKPALIRDLFLLLPVAYLYWHDGWHQRKRKR